MKVICIDGKATTSCFDLPEGVPLEVKQSDVFEDSYLVNGYDYNWVNGKTAHWGKRRFIPCSDQDETESETYKNLSHALQ